MSNEVRRVAQADLRRVERARRLLDEAQAEFERAVRQAVASGETYRDVGRVARRSHQRVWQIVHKQDLSP